MNILILIPAYNEEKRIAQVIANVHHVMPEYDILVVNDGSCDQSGRSYRHFVSVQSWLWRLDACYFKSQIRRSVFSIRSVFQYFVSVVELVVFQ